MIYLIPVVAICFFLLAVISTIEAVKSVKLD
jgi:hypothetical protein